MRHFLTNLRRTAFWASVLLLPSGMTGCGGGGSGGGGKSSGDLLAVTFPDPSGVNASAQDQAPVAAPLNQQIVLEFTAAPRPSEVGPETVPVSDSLGQTVSGTYRVDGRRVIFVPRFPDREPSAASGQAVNNGGAGLSPGQTYTLRLGPLTWNFVREVDAEVRKSYPDPQDPNGIQVSFGTTVVPEDYFRGIPAHRPRLVRADPPDGSSQVTPQLYSNPRGAYPPRRCFTLEFDGPLHPGKQNLDAFRLVDLDATSSAFPAGMPLGIDVELRVNESDRAIVDVMPSGILPFGHLLSLEYPRELRGLAERETSPTSTRVASTFSVAEANSRTIVDEIVENFDDQSRMNVDSGEIRPGEVPADWDERDSNVLTANFAFEGAGELGRFAPPPPADLASPRLVVLDTSVQEFPLLDGSTPEAPPFTRVVGGVFAFTDIDIPEGVILEPRGPNPLVLTATGSVRIAGEFELRGQDGRDENSFDSAVTSLPGGAGGPGGGRGGEGQPIRFVGLQVSKRSLVSPPAGGTGWGPGNRARIGGGGGQSGSFDSPDENGDYMTNAESLCNEGGRHNPGSKPPGGGGGSFLRLGKRPLAAGRGNVLADGQGGFIVRTPENYGEGHNELAGGEPGTAVFSDEDPSNDFFGFRGEVQGVHGGQGGGGGGSGLDSYYCGNWCKKEDSPAPARLCRAEFGLGGGLADSVGDSRGGSAGGGGGAFSIKALGPISIESTARFRCAGGKGGSGEAIGCGNFSGCGGGGSGGAALFQSGTEIVMKAGARIDVAGARGGNAVKRLDACNGPKKPEHRGSAGAGSRGIVQLQVPRGQRAEVEDRSGITGGAWVDSANTRNPSEFTPVSVALSRWYDMGRTIDRAPRGSNPVFRFRGLDPATGQVLTDEAGNVLDPQLSDVRVDFLGLPDPANPGGFLPGLEPRAHSIPSNATVTVEFQGAQGLSPGSKEIDPESVTDWAPSPGVANGMQFLRYRILFDLTAGGGELSPTTPRPTVQSITIRAEF